MTFRRTYAGLSNMCLFAGGDGVDSIVFVEGGNRTISKLDAYQNDANLPCPDTRFWSELFSYYLPDKSFQFRPLGSKLTIVEIADDIVNKRIQNVMVAMDRDFDNHLGRLKRHKWIFYTRGYSRENDVWCNEVIEAVARTLAMVPKKYAFTTNIKSLVREFHSAIKEAVDYDISAAKLNRSCIPRNGHGGILQQSPPFANRNRLDQLVTEFRAANRNVPKANAKVSTDCYGHLHSCFARELVQHTVKSVQGKGATVSKEVLEAIAIEKFIELLSSANLQKVHKHYHSQFARA